MNQALSANALPRQPLQQRAKDRFERVLEEAEAVLLEAGLAGFSIPVLAQRLGYPRATIYKFFPTPYAILNELLRRHLARLEQDLYHKAASFPVGQSWREVAAAVVHFAAEFHNEFP